MFARFWSRRRDPHAPAKTGPPLDHLQSMLAWVEKGIRDELNALYLSTPSRDYARIRAILVETLEGIGQVKLEVARQRVEGRV